MAQILLVDDEKLARSLYGDFLAGAGHEVTAVGSAAEAREALARQPFALLVTDLILPHSDGMELLAHAKSTQPDIEVLVITALDKVEPAVRAIKSGAADYLLKPIQPEVLAHAVNRALAQHSLLKENEALRLHVSLLEAGQRIATTLERDKLYEAMHTAFHSTLGTDALAIFTRGDTGELELSAAQGFGDVARGVIELQTLPRARALLDEIAVHGAPVEIDGLDFKRAWLVPVFDHDVRCGAVLAFFKGEPPSVGLDAFPFLARHVGMALRNQGKFAAVEDLVYLDDHTHLFNSRYLQLVLEKEFKHSTPESKPFALLFLDLDYFKAVNDTHGHLVGSRLLVEVARVLKNCVRDNDVCCRWGGDEYVVLLRGTDSGGALKVAERIRRAIEHHKFLSREGFTITITTCIGVAAFPEHAQDATTLLDFADRAMYRGKKGTRNIIYLAAKNLEATPASRHETPTP